MKSSFVKFYLSFLVIGLSLNFLVLPLASKAASISVPANNYEQDSDYDGLSDEVEINIYKTDPFLADTDEDGYLDSAEVLLHSDPLDANDPAQSLSAETAVATTPTISSLPWYVARASGIASYILMFLVVILGNGMTTGYVYRYINPVKSWLSHKYLSLALTLSVVTHILALFLDKFINFTWQDILIPFASNYKPLLVSLGIFSFYILLIIIIFSLWFRLHYKRAWRSIHYFTYALFTLSLIHGLFIGTDASTLWMKSIYWFTGAVFLYLLINRFAVNLLKRFSKEN